MDYLDPHFNASSYFVLFVRCYVFPCYFYFLSPVNSNIVLKLGQHSQLAYHATDVWKGLQVGKQIFSTYMNLWRMGTTPWKQQLQIQFRYVFVTTSLKFEAYVWNSLI